MVNNNTNNNDDDDSLYEDKQFIVDHVGDYLGFVQALRDATENIYTTIYNGQLWSIHRHHLNGSSIITNTLAISNPFVTNWNAI